MKTKYYTRKSDVTKLLRKLGSSESYAGDDFYFEGCNYSGEVEKCDNGIFTLYIVKYERV